MFKKFLPILFLFCFSFALAQEANSLYVSEKIKISNDTITLQNQKINPSGFAILDKNGNPLSAQNYHINFSKGKLVQNNKALYNQPIDISQLQQGVYVLKTISDDNGVEIHKLVKK